MREKIENLNNHIISKNTETVIKSLTKIKKSLRTTWFYWWVLWHLQTYPQTLPKHYEEEMLPIISYEINLTVLSQTEKEYHKVIYKLISLINTDTKFLNKILSRICKNLCKNSSTYTVNVIYHLNNRKAKNYIAIDGKKVFDKIQHFFLIKTL